jgi:glutathione S-transferase
LYEKQIEFEKREIRTHSDRDELLAVNPRGEVPALRDGDTVVYDSRVICEYLEDRFSERPVVPADPAGRAACRAIEAISDTQIDGCAYILTLGKIFRPDVAATQGECIDSAAALYASYCHQLDDLLGDREFFAGEFSRADIALAPHLSACIFIGFPIPDGCSNLAAWVERVSARPSIVRATAESLAEFERTQNEPDPDPIFDPNRLHWRNDRIEAAIRCGLGSWLIEEFAAGRAFMSPVP